MGSRRGWPTWAVDVAMRAVSDCGRVGRRSRRGANLHPDPAAGQVVTVLFDPVVPAYDIIALFALAAWALVAGTITWALMGWDKRAAGRRTRRISEATLLGWAWLGGGLGLLLGMSTFRHKTRHVRFRVVGAVSAILWAIPVVGALVFLAWEGTGH